jgi:hypothetical protein
MSVPKTNITKSKHPLKTRRENLPPKNAAERILANPLARPLNPQCPNTYGVQNQGVRKEETTPTTLGMTVGFVKKKLELISNTKTLVKLPLKEVPENHSGNLKGCHAGAARLPSDTFKSPKKSPCGRQYKGHGGIRALISQPNVLVGFLIGRTVPILVLHSAKSISASREDETMVGSESRPAWKYFKGDVIRYQNGKIAFTIRKPLGCAAFGEVHLVWSEVQEKLRAMKCTKFGNITPDQRLVKHQTMQYSNSLYAIQYV